MPTERGRGQRGESRGARDREPPPVSDWRCQVPDHWISGSLGSCPWDKGLIHLVYTDTGSRAQFKWSIEQSGWFKQTNRSSKTKIPGAPAGAAAELERIHLENRQLREYHAHVTGDRSSLPASSSGQVPKARAAPYQRDSTPARKGQGKGRQAPPAERRRVLPVQLQPGTGSIAEAAEATPSQADVRAERRRSPQPSGENLGRERIEAVNQAFQHNYRAGGEKSFGLQCRTAARGPSPGLVAH